MAPEVLLVSGGRADWGLLQSPARLLNEDSRFRMRLLVTGSHLDLNLGETVSEIRADGFSVDHQVPILEPGQDDSAAVTKALARAAAGIGTVLAETSPDLIVLLGDRYEILAAASAALIARVPVVHLCGGDVTEGAIDDSIRHAITKMSHLHFVTNGEAAARVAQLGENPACIHVVGNPGLDSLLTPKRQTPKALRDDLGLPAQGPLLLITFHPPTLDERPGEEQFAEVTAALDDLGPEVALLLTGSNADAEGLRLTEAARRYAQKRSNAVFHISLGHERYGAALNAATAVVGNSSSGLYEAPSFGIPTVNIGDRQDGRLRASSVIDCPPERMAITNALSKALTMDASATVSPYGDGQAGQRIVDILARLEAPRNLLHKAFHTLGGTR